MKFSTVVRSLEVQEWEEFTPTSNPVVLFPETRVVRRGYYLCRCGKGFVDLASKRRHMARCIGGK